MSNASRRGLGRAGSVCLAILALAALVPASAAVAQTITTADFREELNFFAPYCNSPRVLQALGRTVGAGPELGEADQISNPCDYGDSITVDVDPTANTVTLHPSGANNYQIIDVKITNIQGASLAGISPVSDTLLDPTSGPYTRTVNFTPNSVTIHYEVNDPANGDPRLEFSTGTAVFQLQAGEPIPALASGGLVLLALLILGAGLAVIRRLT